MLWRLGIIFGGSMATGFGIMAASGSSSMEQLLQIADKAGVILILLLILVGGYRGWWVFGRGYREMESDLRAARSEITDLHSKQLELVKDMAPLLSDATRALREVQTGMEASIRRRPAEVDHLLRRLESVVHDIDDRRGRDDDR